MHIPEGSAVLISKFTTPDYTVKWMRKIAQDNANGPTIQQIAEELSREKDPVQAVFRYAYDNVAYRLDPPSTQRLRTAMRSLKEQYGNCVDYTILISALLQNMGIRHKMRMASYVGSDTWEHIYVVVDGRVLDPVLGQRQDNTDTLHNRNGGYFNKEKKVKFGNRKDFIIMPKLEILGRTRQQVDPQRSTFGLNGCGCGCGGNCGSKVMLRQGRVMGQSALDEEQSESEKEATQKLIKMIGEFLIGDEAKRACDFRYPFNADNRRTCKCAAAAASSETRYDPPGDDTCEDYGFSSRQNPSLNYGVDAVIIYYYKPEAGYEGGTGIRLARPIEVKKGDTVTISGGDYGGKRRVTDVYEQNGKMWVFIATPFIDKGIRNNAGVPITYPTGITIFSDGAVPPDTYKPPKYVGAEGASAIALTASGIVANFLLNA